MGGTSTVDWLVLSRMVSTPAGGGVERVRGGVGWLWAHCWVLRERALVAWFSWALVVAGVGRVFGCTARWCGCVAGWDAGCP
jgi:hypothetical protein